MVRQLLQRLSSLTSQQPHGASSSGSDHSGDDPSSRIDLKRASSILRGEEVRTRLNMESMPCLRSPWLNLASPSCGGLPVATPPAFYGPALRQTSAVPEFCVGPLLAVPAPLLRSRVQWRSIALVLSAALPVARSCGSS